VRVYDSEEWSAVHDWGGHESTVRSLSWARDGTVLATCSDDGSARLWAAVPTPPLGCIARPAAKTAETADTAGIASAAVPSSSPEGVAAAQATAVAEGAGSSVVIDELEVELKDLQVRPRVELYHELVCVAFRMHTFSPALTRSWRWAIRAFIAQACQSAGFSPATRGACGIMEQNG